MNIAMYALSFIQNCLSCIQIYLSCVQNCLNKHNNIMYILLFQFDIKSLTGQDFILDGHQDLPPNENFVSVFQYWTESGVSQTSGRPDDPAKSTIFYEQIWQIQFQPNRNL